MSRREPCRCWYCNRKIRWAHHRSWPEPGDPSAQQVVACARCSSLKGSYSMAQWLKKLRDPKMWPTWGDVSRRKAILKALLFTTKGNDNPREGLR